MNQDDTPLVCPGCGKTLDPSQTLWVLLQRWYCSEACVRAVRTALR